jgi:hypothetical protein
MYSKTYKIIQMKFYFIFLISFSTSYVLLSQKLVWHAEVHHDDIQLRLPISTVLAKLDVDLPTEGKVMVRFDGYCQSSPGDRIIVAASNIEKWETNEGNLGLFAYKIESNNQSFSHQMVYNVHAGSQTFYAIGHNFVDTDGSGRASIHGTLIVEYYPTSPVAFNFNGQGILKYPIILTENAQVISSQKVSIPNKGKVLVHMATSVYSLSNNELEIALNNSEIWPVNNFTSPVHIVNSYATRYANISRVFEVDPGEHEFFMLARKNKGDMTNTNNAFYANMTVQFFPEEENMLASVELVSENINSNSQISNLGNLKIDVPQAGKVILQASGKCKINTLQTALLKIAELPLTEISDPDLKVQKLHENHEEEYFSITKVFPVQKGFNEYTFYGKFDQSDVALSEGIVNGFFTLKYIADPLISSTDKQENANNQKYAVYPNPASDHLFIKINEDTQEFQKVILKDITGKVAIEFDHLVDFIDLSQLTNGIYNLSIHQGNTIITQKIIKSQTTF